ncbi:unnamed protein product [Closterium sp. NIES-65]|nr:unnamed protein product [Closterium sp. NIES-65]
MSRAFLLLLALSALLAAAAGVAAATKPPRSGGVALRGGDGSVTGGTATAGGRGGSGGPHAVSHGDSRHGGIPGGGSDEEREDGDGGHGGHGGRGHGDVGGSSSHGGGLCGRGGCSNDAGEVGYWKLPDYGRCSIDTSSSSGGAPRKANEAWCAGAAMGVRECCSRCSSTNVTADGTPFNCLHWVHIPSPDSHDRRSSEQRGKCVLIPAVDTLTPERARKGRCGTNTGGDTMKASGRGANGGGIWRSDEAGEEGEVGCLGEWQRNREGGLPVGEGHPDTGADGGPEREKREIDNAEAEGGDGGGGGREASEATGGLEGKSADDVPVFADDVRIPSDDDTMSVDDVMTLLFSQDPLLARAAAVTLSHALLSPALSHAAAAVVTRCWQATVAAVVAAATTPAAPASAPALARASTAAANAACAASAASFSPTRRCSPSPALRFLLLRASPPACPPSPVLSKPTPRSPRACPPAVPNKGEGATVEGSSNTGLTIGPLPCTALRSSTIVPLPRFPSNSTPNVPGPSAPVVNSTPNGHVPCAALSLFHSLLKRCPHSPPRSTLRLFPARLSALAQAAALALLHATPWPPLSRLLASSSADSRSRSLLLLQGRQGQQWEQGQSLEQQQEGHTGKQQVLEAAGAAAAERARAAAAAAAAELAAGWLTRLLSACVSTVANSNGFSSSENPGTRSNRGDGEFADVSSRQGEDTTTSERDSERSSSKGRSADCSERVLMGVRVEATDGASSSGDEAMLEASSSVQSVLAVVHTWVSHCLLPMLVHAPLSSPVGSYPPGPSHSTYLHHKSLVRPQPPTILPTHAPPLRSLSCSPWPTALPGPLLSLAHCSPWPTALPGPLLSPLF